MQFYRRHSASPKRLGILPGAFNPPTVAHLALARAALKSVDEVLFVVPQVLPHKSFSGASLSERIDLVLQAVGDDLPHSVAIANGGLYMDIVRECRTAYGDGPELWCLCGRDAAERIAGWDYGVPGAFERMLDEFGLLVAARSGEYSAPESLRHRIRTLELNGTYDHVSATEVRERIARGEPWEHLVPERITAQVRRIFSSGTASIAV
jgi:nicotinate-nucleotide adenylyltransferase